MGRWWMGKDGAGLGRHGRPANSNPPTLDALAAFGYTAHTMGTLEIAKPSPIEVWLTKSNIKVTCQVVREDESTEDLAVESLSMRGAQREVTGRYISQGYKPVGRWMIRQPGDDKPAETSRLFKLASPDVG